MNRYVVTFRNPQSKTRMVTVAADGIINARIEADRNHRMHGEQIIKCMPYDSLIKISCR